MSPGNETAATPEAENDTLYVAIEISWKELGDWCQEPGEREDWPSLSRAGGQGRPQET